MAKLVAFGDSFTWGSELNDSLDYWKPEMVQEPAKYEDELLLMRKYNAGPYAEIDDCYNMKTSSICYSRNTWIALLAKYLNFDYYCYAVPGGSNQTIIRRFLQYMPHINDDDFIVINWTYIDRWDFVNPDKLPIKDQWVSLTPSSNNKTKFEKFYFRYIQNELWNKWESLKVMLMACNILKVKNIKFIFTILDELVLDNKWNSPSYILNAQTEIKNHIKWFDNKGFDTWCTDKDFERGIELHPLEEAHVAAFEYIKNNWNINNE